MSQALKTEMAYLKANHINWLECIWDSDLDAYSKLICAYLRRFMNNQQDVAWPSYKMMVCQLGISHQTIMRRLDSIEKAGWISRERGSPKKNTRYFISFPRTVERQLSTSSQDIGTSSEDIGYVLTGHQGTSSQDNESDNSNQTNKISKGKLTRSRSLNDDLTDTSWAS